MVANPSALDLTSLLGSAFDTLSKLTLRESNYGDSGQKAAIRMPQITDEQAMAAMMPAQRIT